MAMPSAPAAACQASSITEPRQAALASPLALVAPQDWAAAARLRHPGIPLASPWRYGRLRAAPALPKGGGCRDGAGDTGASSSASL